MILDVVYNHVGASGNDALQAFGPYFTDKYGTPWGEAINYDDAELRSRPRVGLQSAEGWVGDFGSRRSAARRDPRDLRRQRRARRRRGRPPRPRAVNPGCARDRRERTQRPQGDAPATDGGGWGCDAAWADDFHHALRTLITDERDGYYADFGTVAQLAKALHRPHVDDGDYSPFRHKRFGAPADDVAAGAVRRLLPGPRPGRQPGLRRPDAEPGAAAGGVLLTLLSPFTPMLFMGEEYGELAPFQFFTNHIDPDIAEATRTGRRAGVRVLRLLRRRGPRPRGSGETFSAPS